MGTEGIWIPLLLSGLSAGASIYNTNKTASRQDAATAASIRNQSAKQREADARVNEEVQKLQGSTSADERAQRLDQYMTQLRRNRAGQASGLSPVVGSDTFKQDAAGALEGVQNQAGMTAGLMARMDAPAMQRQGEAFDYGHLGTDIGLLSREAKGQQFLDELRMRAVKRNPWLDAFSGLTGAAASGWGTGIIPENSNILDSVEKYTPMQYGGRAVYGVGGRVA